MPLDQAAPVLEKLNHVAALVRDLPAAIARYQAAFGAKLIAQETLANGADVAVLELGEMHLELLSTRQEGTKVAKLLDELGEGIHHLSYSVGDMDGAMERLRSAGLRFRDQVPRVGLHGRPIAFLEPEDTFGVLIELVGEQS